MNDNHEQNPGRKSLNYTGYVFKAKYICSSCGNKVFINNIKDHVICPHCKEKKKLNAKWWKDNLLGKRLLKEVLEIEENTAQTIDIWGGDNLSLAYGNGYPRCKDCKDKLSEDEYWTIAEIEEATKQGSINCKKCKKVHSIRKPDSFVSSLFDFPVIAVINEEQDTDKNNKSNKITIKCNSCGANIKTHENKRTAICEYCETENILPESLFKPDIPIQYTFNVLLKQKHKPFQDKATKQHIEDMYWKKEKENKKAEIEKEIKEIKKKTISALIGLVFMALTYAGIFVYVKNPDIIGFKEKIEIKGTNLSLVQLYNKEWGVVNTNNSEYAIPAKYIFIEHFFKDIFIFRKRNIGACGLINSKNEIIFKQDRSYKKLNYLVNDSNMVFGSGYIIYGYKEDRKELYNINGEKILSNKFYIEGTIDNYIKIKNNKDKYGLADTLGNIVLPTKYNNIISVENDYATIKQKAKTRKIKLLTIN